MPVSEALSSRLKNLATGRDRFGGGRPSDKVPIDTLEELHGFLHATESNRPTSVERLHYAKADVVIHVGNRLERELRLSAPEKEPWIIEWMETSFKPGDVVYDIGANVGVFSLIAAKLVGPGGQVVAFEPSFANFARLCENIHSNGLDGRILPIPVIIGRELGTAVLIHRTPVPGESGHKVDKHYEGRRLGQRVLVSNLEQIASDFGVAPPNHIKMDVAGAELDALRGAISILQNEALRSVLLEIDPAKASRIDKLMVKYGFGEGTVVQACDATRRRSSVYHRLGAAERFNKALLNSLAKLRQTIWAENA
jgi:FkbM family methyltransferase